MGGWAVLRIFGIRLKKIVVQSQHCGGYEGRLGRFARFLGITSINGITTVWLVFEYLGDTFEKKIHFIMATAAA